MSFGSLINSKTSEFGYHLDLASVCATNLLSALLKKEIRHLIHCSVLPHFKFFFFVRKIEFIESLTVGLIKFPHL